VNTRGATCLLLAALAQACADDTSSLEVDDQVPCDASYPSFTPGMSVMAGAMTVKLQSIRPAPPRQKVKNDWVVQVLDASGAPAPEIALAYADSYMPVHRHHGNTPPVPAAGTEPGSAQLNDIDFIMRGPWQVIFDVQQRGTKVGTATFQICVE
jgi:hypothetical protein